MHAVHYRCATVQGRRLFYLIIGRGSGLARAVAVAALDAGAYVALTNTFLTGQTLHIDGGEPLT
jgi:hypothetical protein